MPLPPGCKADTTNGLHSLNFSTILTGFSEQMFLGCDCKKDYNSQSWKELQESLWNPGSLGICREAVRGSIKTRTSFNSVITTSICCKYLRRYSMATSTGELNEWSLIRNKVMGTINNWVTPMHCNKIVHHLT